MSTHMFHALHWKGSITKYKVLDRKLAHIISWVLCEHLNNHHVKPFGGSKYPTFIVILVRPASPCSCW